MYKIQKLCFNAKMAKEKEIETPEYQADPQDNLNFFAYIEGLGRKNLDPLSQEALEIQARYVQELPQHPMDVVRRIMTNPFCTPAERISAAKTLMQYSMRAIPSNVEVTGKDGGAIKVDASQLAALCAEDLDTLSAILEKAAQKT